MSFSREFCPSVPALNRFETVNALRVRTAQLARGAPPRAIVPGRSAPLAIAVVELLRGELAFERGHDETHESAPSMSHEGRSSEDRL